MRAPVRSAVLRLVALAAGAACQPQSAPGSLQPGLELHVESSLSDTASASPVRVRLTLGNSARNALLGISIQIQSIGPVVFAVTADTSPVSAPATVTNADGELIFFVHFQCAIGRSSGFIGTGGWSGVGSSDMAEARLAGTLGVRLPIPEGMNAMAVEGAGVPCAHSIRGDATA